MFECLFNCFTNWCMGHQLAKFQKWKKEAQKDPKFGDDFIRYCDQIIAHIHRCSYLIKELELDYKEVKEIKEVKISKNKTNTNYSEYC